MNLEALNPEAKEIFRKLGDFRNFYLAGGTALALQIGHRMSVDFDLFTEKPLPADFYLRVEQIFSKSKKELIVNNPDELTILVDGVKLTFLKYPFGPILSLVELQSVKILSILDIAANKAYTLGRRATYKDYVDLYFILSEKHCSLEQIIETASKKFKQNFDPRLFLEQLIYLEDVTDIDIMFLKNPIHSDIILDFFEDEVRKLKL